MPLKIVDIKVKGYERVVHATNEKLWKIEDEIRLCEKNSNFNEKFIQISRDIYFANDNRSKIKLEINKILGSNIREVKQYTKYTDSKKL